MKFESDIINVKLSQNECEAITETRSILFELYFAMENDQVLTIRDMNDECNHFSYSDISKTYEVLCWLEEYNSKVQLEKIQNPKIEEE